MKKHLVSLFMLCYGFTHAQSGLVDSTFNIKDAGRGITVTSWVYTISELPDHRYFIGGSFTSVQDAVCNRLAVIDSNSRRITTFNTGTGLNSICYSSAYRSDGKIVIGGNFTVYNGTSAKKIAVLNMDGTVDSTFACWDGANDRINVVRTQPDNKMLVGGLFTQYAGFNQGRFSRLTIFGTIDNSFNTGTGFNGEVTSIEIQPDGKILVGGAFTSYNGTPCNRIIRLKSDGTVDETFVYGYGFNSQVNTISYNSTGQIAVGGNFSLYDSLPARKIIVLNEDGSPLPGFAMGTGYSAYIHGVDFDTDTTIVVVTELSGTYNGVNCQTNSRLKLNGQLDPGYSASQMYGLRCVKALPDGRIMFGGYFDRIYQHLRTNLVRVHSNGTPDFSFTPYGGSSSVVYALELDEHGAIYAGGSFDNFNGKFSQRIVKLEGDGELDFNYTTGVYATGSYGSGAITKIKSLSNGVQYASGTFTLLNVAANINYEYFMRISASGAPQNIDYGLFQVNDMGVQSNDKLIVGGGFIFVMGQSFPRMCRINADGTLDYTFTVGTGFNAAVNCLKVLDNNKILTGGAFTSYNGSTINKFCRLLPDGQLDTTFHIGSGPNGNVKLIDVSNEGKIILYGDFTSFNGVSRNKMVQLFANGDVDTSFDAGTLVDSTILALVYQQDGKLIVGGNFVNAQGIPYNRIAKFNQNGELDTTFTVGTGFNGIVRTLKVKQDGTILAGGDFTKYNGYNRTRLAAIKDRYANSGIDQVHACGPYTWIDGQTYYEANNSATFVLQNLSGGDSVAYLNLTVGEPSGSNVTIVACDSYTVGADTFTSSGVYNALTTNASGCDSSVVLNLTINHSASSPLVAVTSCGPYTWPLNGMVYNSQGHHYDTIQTVSGCDSVVGIDLTLYTLPTTLVTLHPNGYLHANAASAYQWYDCDGDTVIPGATLQDFTPSINGNYACMITNAFNCSNTSNCFAYTIAGNNELQKIAVEISPNPTRDFLRIDLHGIDNTELRIYDVNGKQLVEQTAVAGETVDVRRLQSGVYLIEMVCGHTVQNFRFVKE